MRSVGAQLVFLQSLKPKFQCENGRLQIGSDYQEVFNHVAVQTYQLQQILDKHE